MDNGGAPSRRQVWSVAGLLNAASDALAARFAACLVRGALCPCTRPQSGHCSFTMKDGDRGDAAFCCAVFRRAASLLDFTPADGQPVDVRGRLDVYGARGEL